ncbi:uncharacterized protein isoform X2 [Salmo salar]|uniref:Uncharacterized protein isoform X2 n=1 Tax=Salmo salar TaxID=8030 RepID=A0ABM3DND0_SALSA|nr:uncharacterized protein LOC106565696 isoform X2 [Salmo salar]
MQESISAERFLTDIFTSVIIKRFERWYKLNSKTGKKEKERGDIQVTVQFTKNNLTASMYDLSLGKDKPRSTFGKIKDRIKGKKRSSKDSDEDSASTIVGGYGPVSRMRNRLPSDGGGEEDYEDDEGGEGRRSKMRNFFLRGKLRKSSDTRSSTSLGSESSESSSRGGSLSPTAGISVVVSDLSNSPSNSSNFTADSPDHTAESSPKLASYTCEFTDESGEINIPVPQPVCINGSHVYNTILDPCPGNPVVPLDPLALVKKNLPLSQSLQNLSQRREELPVLLPKGPAADGRRWSFDKAGEEEKVVIAAALEQAGQGMGEGAREESDRDSQGRKRSRDCLDESEQASNSDSGPGEKHKGWFGSKDNHNKPSPVVSPSSGPHLTPHTPSLTPLTPGLTPHTPSLTPLTPGLTPHTPGLLSWGPPHLPVDPNSLGTSLRHTNPFSPSPPTMSPSNPFLSLLQCNPFYEELLADRALNLNSAQPHLPPCCSSFTSRISVAPQTWSTNPNPVPILPLTQDCTNTGMKEQRPFLKPPPEEKSANTKDKEEEAATVKTSQRSLPPLPKTERMSSADTPLCEEDMSYTKAEKMSSANSPLCEEDMSYTKAEKMSSANSPLCEEDMSYTKAETMSSANTPLCEEDMSYTKAEKMSSANSPLCEEDMSYTKAEKMSSANTPLCEEDMSYTKAEKMSSADTPLCEEDMSYTKAERMSSADTPLCEEDMSYTKAEKMSSADTPLCEEDMSYTKAETMSSADTPLCEEDMSYTKAEKMSSADTPLCEEDMSYTKAEKMSSADTPLCEEDMSYTKAEKMSSANSPLCEEDMSYTKAETMSSANTPLCEEDMSYTKAETASFHSATGSDNMAALDLMGEFSDDRCWAALDDVIQSDTLDRATSHLGAMRVDKEKTTSSEARIDWPIGMDLKSYNSAELSDALLHSFSSQAHSPLKTFQSSTGTSSGEKVNEDIEDYKSEDQYSEHPRVESVVVQRSLSEGTSMNSVEDLTPSFGSDPGVVTLGSLSFVQQHDTSDLLAASSFFFSAPSSLTAESNTSSCPALSSLPAPPPATVRSSVSTVSAAPLFSTAQPVIGASHAGMPQETHPPANQQISPHPVKPLTPEERRRAELSEGRSVLDKLKSSIHPGWSSQPTEQQPEKKKSLTEGAGPYYHLTHSELVALLLQREADLHRQRAEFDQQGALLAKREAELKKMKPQVRDLEDYIDTLLVRIMEQTPTILQVGTKLK